MQTFIRAIKSAFPTFGIGYVKPEILSKTKRPATDILYYGNAAAITETNPDAGWTQLHQKAYDNSLSFSDLYDLTNGNAQTLLTNEIDLYDEYGQTPLWWACSKCNIDAYHLLKFFGSNLKQKDYQDRTLMHAITSGSSYMCKKIAIDLYKNGISIDDMDILKSTPIEYLRELTNPYDDRREKNMQDTLNALMDVKL